MSALSVGESAIHLETNGALKRAGRIRGIRPEGGERNRPLTRVGKDSQEIGLSTTVCRQAAKRFKTKRTRTGLGFIYFKLSHHVWPARFPPLTSPTSRFSLRLIPSTSIAGWL